MPPDNPLRQYHDLTLNRVPPRPAEVEDAAQLIVAALASSDLVVTRDGFTSHVCYLRDVLSGRFAPQDREYTPTHFAFAVRRLRNLDYILIADEREILLAGLAEVNEVYMCTETLESLEALETEAELELMAIEPNEERAMVALTGQDPRPNLVAGFRVRRQPLPEGVVATPRSAPRDPGQEVLILTQPELIRQRRVCDSLTLPDSEEERRELRRQITSPPPIGVPPTDTAGAATELEDQQPAAPVRKPEFVLAPDGDGYFVRAFGAEGHFSNLAGFRDLDRLLRSPGKPVSMTELDSQPEHGSSRSRQPTLDPPARKDIEKDIERLRLEVSGAENEVEKADSQEKLDELLSRYKSATGIGGKSRDMNDPAGNLRARINGRIETVRKTLRKASPSLAALADHLESPTIRAEGLTFIYDPRKPVSESDPAIPVWDFSPVSR